jgi:N-formylglutamate amidohydrolase
MRRIGLVFLLFLLVDSCATQVDPPVYPPDKAPADLILIQRGALPIILTAPHGGHEAIPAVEARRAEGTTSGPWGGVHKGGDLNTDLLAQGIAAEITKLTGKAPYLVVAKFQRRFIDANRPPELALEDPRARPYYDYYHGSIRGFVDQVRRVYPAGLLIDVHGQTKDPDVVMRGTLNGRGVERLLRRAGVDAVTGSRGIFGQLEINGFTVFPGNDVPPQGHSEDAGFNGGYTVFTYGSHNRNGIDALQMEFGTRYRQRAGVEESARGAAKAIAAFYQTYLTQPTSR